MTDLSIDRAIPMFPLPDVVLFPNVELPLHVFEPRYLELIADALAADRRIVIATLKPGHESEYHGRPPVFDVATVAHITRAMPLPDDRILVLLTGEQRVRLLGFDDSKPYRIARCRPLDAPAPAPAPAEQVEAALEVDLDLEDQTRRLLALYALSQTGDGRSTARMPGLKPNAALAQVVNTLAFTAKLPTDNKLSLLTQPMTERAHALEDALMERSAPRLN